MSSYYDVAKCGDGKLEVVTHGGKLDLDVVVDDNADLELPITLASCEPHELAALGIRLIEIAALNDYSAEGSTQNISGTVQDARRKLIELAASYGVNLNE